MNTMKLLVSLQRLWRPRPLVWALALAGVATHGLVPGVGEAHAAGALPTGLNVVRGQATVAQTGNQMTVTNSAGAVLNWQSFNIGAANVVRFDQPSASSKVLNRVVGNDPSQIFGKLSSNGEVWLVNPYGVLFGRDSRVDVGALVVSTLNIGNDDWRAGRFSLSGGAGNNAAIVNQGELRTVTGGRVFLVAGAGGVRNEGLISAPDGQVALAAGASVDLVDGQTRHLAVRVQAPQGEVLNLGSIAAGNGRIDLAAAMVNQQGFVRAESLSGSGGQIVMTGSEGVNLAAGSVTSAAGAEGGQVQVDGGRGTTMLAGEVNVTGSAGQGGDALLLGRQVGLLDGAVADASGATGGGRIRVGGGLQGKDTSVTNARAVYMGQGASLKADATHSGDGGTLILWSDEATRAYGSLSARGGSAAGNGGFIETSGGWLDVMPASIRTDALRGKAGTWLLDPNNLFITDNTSDGAVTAGPNFTTQGNNAQLSTATINRALLGGNVVITTADVLGPNDTGPQAGDITISGANITSTATQRNSLTINASRNLVMSNSTIESNANANAAPLDVTFSAGNGTSGIGAISLFDSSIVTRGGNINLGGPTRAVGPTVTSPRAGAVGAAGGQLPAIGVSIAGSVLDASAATVGGAAGNIGIVGQSIGGGGRGSAGVSIDEISDGDGGFIQSRIVGRDIDIYGWVDSNSNEVRSGIQIGAGATITARHGLTLTGVANAGANVANTAVDTEPPTTRPTGVALAGGQLLVQPAAADSTSFMNINAGSDLLLLAGGLGGDPGTVTLAGRDIRLSGAGLSFGQTLNATVTLNAIRDIQLFNSNISASGTAITLSLNAAQGASGSGAISLLNSGLYSFDGTITLGGGSTAVGANITAPGAGAVASDGTTQQAGVTILDSAINAGVGKLRITGQSVVADGSETAGVWVGTRGAGGSQVYGGDIDIFGWVDSNGAARRTGVLVDGFTQVVASNSLKITGVANSSVFRLGDAAVVGVHIDGSAVGLALPFGQGGGGVRPAGTQVALGVVQAPVPSALTIDGTTNDAARGDPETARTRYGVLVDNDAVVTTNYIFDRPAPQPAGRVGINEVAPAQLPKVTITGTDLSANDDVSVRIETLGANFEVASSLAITGNHRIELAGAMVAPLQGTADVRAGTTLLLDQFALSGGPTTATLRGDTFLRANGSINFEAPTAVTLQSPEVRLGDGGNLDVITLGTIRVLTDRYVTVQPSTLRADATGTAIAIAGYDGQSGITSLQATTLPATMDTELGRSLIYARDDSIPENGLNFQFRQYNMTYPAEPTATGNGLVYTLAPVLTLSSPTAITKLYDGGNAVATGGITFSLSGFRPGQSADQGLGTLTLTYASPNVGNNQLLTVGGYTQSTISDSGERPVYGYTTRFDVRGSITPLNLVYVAQPATLTTTQLPGATLTGTVQGFLEGENLGNATTGTLRFTTPATTQSQPGQYAILGSGLVAGNYTFVQGEGNGTALTLLAPPAPTVTPLPEGLPEIESTTRAYRQALPPLPRGPEGTRALDALQTLRVDPSWLSMAFGELDLSSMSREEIAALLEARRQYKMQILAVGRERLTQDPALADVPACQTAKQAETGRCLVSAELLAAIDAGGEAASIEAPGPAPAVAAVAAAPAAPRPAAAAPAPAPLAAAPVAPAPAPVARPPSPAPVAPAPVAAAPAAPAVAAAAPAPRPAAAEARTPPRVRVAAQPVLVPPPIPSARAVQSASIPQIQRKIAVLVGIDNYVDERIPSLDNARRDVDAVARILEQRLGYETLIVRDAGREAMVGLLNRLALQVRPNDSVVVYYAGHGTVIDDTKQGYWIPATADAERPETWISNRDIGKLLGSLRASQVVLISDSCFSGSLVGDKRVQASSTTDARAMLQRRATLVMSSGGDEPVADGAVGGHSPFSNSLMATLQGLDNWRVGGNVFDKVRDDVTKRLPQTPRYGPARDARSVEGADYLFEQRQLGQR